MAKSGLNKEMPKSVKIPRLQMTLRKPKSWIFFALTSICVLWAIVIPFAGVADEIEYLQYGAYSTSNDLFQNPNLNIGLLTNLRNSGCIAFHPDMTANCQRFTSNSSTENGKNHLAPYPKIWFYLTAWPALVFSGQNGLILAKLLACLLSLAVLGISILFWKKSNLKLALSLAIALPSLSLQMVGSYNPNGFEIAGLTAVGLMLFGQPPNELDKRSRLWWISLWCLSLLSSSAKPMTGVLTLCIFGLFHFLNFSTEDRYLKKYFAINELRLNFKRAQLLIIPVVCFAFSYLLSRPAIAVARVALKPSHQGIRGLTLGFLSRSDAYANEYAGIFGWREIGPAPGCTTAWMLLLGIAIYLAFRNSKPRVRFAISLIWFLVFIIAPLLEVISLANNYNVGLQTRYLAGVYGFSVVATISRIPEHEHKGYRLAKIATIVAAINLIWVYLRFAIGYPQFILKPTADLGYLIGNQAWHPLFVGPALLLAGLLAMLLVSSSVIRVLNFLIILFK